jgi:hypothetical protein
VTYPLEAVERFTREAARLEKELLLLQLEFVRIGEATTNPGAREYLLHGCGRRVLVIVRSLANVFRIFPVSRTRKLARDELADVQISMHAFMMNLYGFFENCAWVVWHRDGLQQQVKERRDVGLFNPKFQSHLPATLRAHLDLPATKRWHVEYLKNYRDALAHRIPVYLPPSQMTSEQGERYRQLEFAKIERLRAMDVDGFKKLEEEQTALEQPCFMFLHSFAEDGGSRPVYLHPQLLTDAMTLLEFGKVFLDALEAPG